jgi:putative DNA primase/helicase
VFKPLLATNHKPEIKGVDEGIWRRVVLLPFTVTIPTPERDQRLGEKLERELSGILSWALVGLDDYLRNGLVVPNEVVAATQDYGNEQDLHGGWIDDNCIFTPEVSDEFAASYEDYVGWCEKNSEEPINKAKFSASLGERGCPARRGTKGKRMRDCISRTSEHG